MISFREFLIEAKQANKSFISLSDVDMIKIAFANGGGRGKASQYKAGSATIIMQNDYDYVEIKKSLFGDEEFAALSIALKNSKLGKIK